jgi:hypothetical protein
LAAAWAAAWAASALARTSPSAGGKLAGPPALAGSAPRLGRAFFSGLPMVASFSGPGPKSGPDARPGTTGFTGAGGVASPAVGPALGDFLEPGVLSGSAECARFNCGRKRS